MPFSTEDKVIIKHYRLDKYYVVKRLLKEFPNKGWTKGGLRGICCVKLTKLETLHGLLVVVEPLRLSLMKMLKKVKSLFLVKKKIQELIKFKEILEESLVYQEYW